MKHNTWFLRILSSLILTVFTSTAFAKVVNSEFLNQAGYGSEGPQLHELELAGTRTYLLTYNTTGKNPLFRNLSKKEYLKLQKEMRMILEQASKSDDQEPCDKELTYTKVEKEKSISNSTLCWERLTSEQRVQISDWFIEIRKSLR